MPPFDVTWITFDMGGTLLFPNPSVGEIYAEVLSRHGHVRDPRHLEDNFMRIWKADVQQCLPEISAEGEKQRWRSVVHRTFEGVEPLDLDSLFDELWIAFAQAHRWRLPEGAIPTLQALQDRGYQLAVLSNWDERLRPLMAEIGLEEFFEHVFVSYEMGVEKPDSRIFAAVEEKLSVPGHQILHIGDSYLHDVEGAQRQGWRTVQAFCELSPDSPCPQISRLSDLLDWLPRRNRSRTPQEPPASLRPD